MKYNKINLTLFGNDKDFFTSAFEEANPITIEESSETVEEGVETSNDIDDTKIEETVGNTSEEPQKPSKEEVKRMYEEYYGSEEQVNEVEPELDEETQSAIELMKYLQDNPHLVQAMRNVDSEGYQNLNNYVPDELTQRLNELEDFKRDMHYKEYVSGLKSKYNDFDEEKVLQYAEDKDILDLEVAYKALKSDEIQTPNVDEMREQIRKEIMEELKNNSLNTQTIIGGASQKPINQTNEISLSSREQRIARAMGISPSDYVKWR